jgi:hypothetical protein
MLHRLLKSAPADASPQGTRYFKGIAWALLWLGVAFLAGLMVTGSASGGFAFAGLLLLWGIVGALVT